VSAFVRAPARAPLAFALALALALAPALARAAPVTFELTESLSVDWHWVLDDAQLVDEADREDVVDLRNRLNLRLRTGAWTFGLRLDAAWFPSPPSAQYESDLRPEEMFITYKDKSWTLTAGDDYLTIGRGLALSLRKFDEIGFATNLRGAHARFRTDGFEMRLGAGFTNVVNVDSVEEKLVPDPNDLVFLARIESDALGPLTLGAHVVDIERRHSDVRLALTDPLFGDGADDLIQGRRFERTLITGFTAELAFDGVDINAEAGYLTNDETRATLAGDTPSGEPGVALYLGATGTFGRWTALLEGKHYDHWRVDSSLHPETADAQGVTQFFPYVTPPSLERIDQRVVNNTDVSGVHLRLDHAFPPSAKGNKLILFASGAFFVDAPAQGEWTLHTYGGLELTTASGDRLVLQTGYRREEAPDAGTDGIIRLGMWHLDLDWSKTIAKAVDLQMHWTHEFRDKNIGADSLAEGYYEGTFYLSVNLPPAWSITGQLEYLTNSATVQSTFPGAFLQWKPDSASFVRLFVGRSKGGLKCSGGVCRIFPDFEGVKLETTLRF